MSNFDEAKIHDLALLYMEKTYTAKIKTPEDFYDMYYEVCDKIKQRSTIVISAKPISDKFVRRDNRDKE